LDIGSGQGQFAIDYQRANPGVTVFGVEYSAEGVRRSVDRARILGVPARFIQRDLLHPVRRAADQPLATHAVCSEVLEHVEDPATLLRNATTMLAPGAKVVITVPGGPRSAFDRHIGHFRHFSSTDLREVLVAAGLRVEVVLRSGFPFFNLYKLAVIARGEKLVTEMATRSSEAAPSPLERAATRFFSSGFRRNLDDFPIGWQLVAVAYVPAVDRAC
jgi:SAM-dependent methyltransferase